MTVDFVNGLEILFARRLFFSSSKMDAQPIIATVPPGRIQLGFRFRIKTTIIYIYIYVQLCRKGFDSIASRRRKIVFGRRQLRIMRGHDHPHAQVRETRKVTRGTTSGRMIPPARGDTGRAHLFARGNSFTQRFARPGLSRRTTRRPRSLLIYSVHLELLSRQGKGGKHTNVCSF